MDSHCCASSLFQLGRVTKLGYAVVGAVDDRLHSDGNDGLMSFGVYLRRRVYFEIDRG